MAIRKRPVSPRQKMINLMYVILMAMLTINVSNSVLDGFSVIDDSLMQSTENSARENQVLYGGFEDLMQVNSVKTKAWYDKAQEVRRISDSLYVFADMLKLSIVREADGENADVKNIRNKEDLEAAPHVMLNPVNGKGLELCLSINKFRETMTALVRDSAKRVNIAGSLSTEVPLKVKGKKWEEYMFESMSVSAAMIMLSKLQNDIRYVEGEVLHALMRNIDEEDIRVNNLKAFVVPNAQTIFRGNVFKAQIGLAAIDTTQVPEIFIDGKKVNLKDGVYDILCTRTGEFTLNGWMEVTNNKGDVIRKDFAQKYNVIDPSATVSADLTNILYAGYENPISISVPGIPLNAVTASMDGGTLIQKSPGRYIAKPTKNGKEVRITVFSNNMGRRQQMAQCTFKVRKLPEPAPFIVLRNGKDNTDRFKGGALAKTKLLTATKISAAVDDGILYVPFKVKSFEMVFFDNMGNAVPIISDTENISVQQKETIRKLSRGRRLYISRLTAIGPDGTERKLNSSMEVILR